MATMSTGQLTGIYSALIISALVLSIVLMLSLTLSHAVFIGIFAFYMCTCATFHFTYFTMNKKQLDPSNSSVQYKVADYMALFNMILCLFIFIMSFVIPMIRKNKELAIKNAYGPALARYGGGPGGLLKGLVKK